MIQNKKFLLNGELYSTTQHLTLFQLLDYFNYQDCLFVVEYNNLVLNKIKWNETFIKNSDRIEIITIVGGG